MKRQTTLARCTGVRRLISISIFSSFTLVRYNTDGSLDATFGAGGIVEGRRIFRRSKGMDLAIQSDGRIRL